MKDNTVETAEQFALTITSWGTSKFPSWVITVSAAVAARDTAIREAMASEVLDWFSEWAEDVQADFNWENFAYDFNKQFCSTPPHSPTTTPVPDTTRVKTLEELSEKVAEWRHDADVAMAAKVEVLREIHAFAEEHFGYDGIICVNIRRLARIIATRHGIDPAELETKKYTVSDIKAVPGKSAWYVRCGDIRSSWCWVDDSWQEIDPMQQNDMAKMSEFTARAIAAKLILEENLPGGAK